jgi:hypothetical protein
MISGMDKHEDDDNGMMCTHGYTVLGGYECYTACT